MTPEQRKFEEMRLALFEKFGTSMSPLRVEDRHGRETYLMDSGGDGPPVLMVHGGGAEGSVWAPICPALSPDHRVLVVDRPGCGLSFPIEYGGFDFRDAAADWFEDVVEGLGLASVDVVATSMGAFFSLVYALRGDHRIRRLVLVGAPAGVDRWVPMPLRLLGLKGVNRLVLALAGGTEVDDMRRMYDGLLVADVASVDEESLEIAARARALPGAQVAGRTMLEECMTLGGFRRRYLIRDEVASLEVETLMVWGEEDAFAPPESGEELAARMPDATVVRVPGAGHSPWYDAREMVNAPIAEFLSFDRRPASASA